MLPMPPLVRFPQTRVYAGHNFFPLADQFLLVPRRFAHTVFGAISLCFDCKALKAQQESKLQAQTESLLHTAMRQDNVPIGYYEFPVVIVRSNEGGVCKVLHPHKIECEMLRVSGLMGPSTTPEGGGGEASEAVSCADVMNRWYRQACIEMFPPLEQGAKSERSEAVEVGGEMDSSGWIRGEVGGRSNVVGGVGDDVERGGDETRSEETPGPAAASAGAANGARIVSFDEATRRVSGVQEDLRDLLGSMKVHANPKQSSLNYFVAHHYPFQRVNGGPLDEVSIIEGNRLSEADFHGLALSFSCLLSNITNDMRETETDAVLLSPIHARVTRGVGHGDGPGADNAEDEMLVLKTTAPEEESLDALVDCSLVAPLHDVRISLLDHTFEPSETICRGYAGPCLDRARAEFGDL